MKHGLPSEADLRSLSGEITPAGHRIFARIYFADTDFTGVVYHARYLEFFERGRSDFLRLAGVHHNELADGIHGETLAWVVKRIEIDFRSPARIDDIITISTRTERLSGARIYMSQEIVRGETVLVTARVEAALINGEGRPRRFPKSWADSLLSKTPE